MINNILTKFHSASIHIVGDFNINYWLVHTNKTDGEGNYFSIVYELAQIIKEPAHDTDATGHKVNLLKIFLTCFPGKCLANVLLPTRDARPSSTDMFKLIASQSSLDFPFPRMTFRYTKEDWKSFRSYLTEAPHSKFFMFTATKDAALVYE